MPMMEDQSSSYSSQPPPPATPQPPPQSPTSTDQPPPPPIPPPPNAQFPPSPSQTPYNPNGTLPYSPTDSNPMMQGYNSGQIRPGYQGYQAPAYLPPQQQAPGQGPYGGPGRVDAKKPNNSNMNKGDQQPWQRMKRMYLCAYACTMCAFNYILLMFSFSHNRGTWNRCCKI